VSSRIPARPLHRNCHSNGRRSTPSAAEETFHEIRFVRSSIGAVVVERAIRREMPLADWQPERPYRTLAQATADQSSMP
jgi:hypothetical protein